MMETIGRYIVSLSAAAMICGILKSFLPSKSPSAAVLQLVAGIFLTFVAIRPLTRVELGDLPVISGWYLSDGEDASAQGDLLAKEAMADIIKSQTEAYILDKARLLQAELHVTVILSDDDPQVPVSVRLSGFVSPYARSRLEHILWEDLGIAKENQIWIG